MNKHEQQSILGNEVENMSDGKKYTAQEAAIAVLKKAGEMLKKFEATKTAPIQKSEQIPAKASEEKDATPSDNVETQVAPEKNPKEQAEGNNELAGTTPTQVGQDGKNVPGHAEIISGHIKLAKFIGRMHAKRKTPPGAM